MSIDEAERRRSRVVGGALVLGLLLGAALAWLRFGTI